MVGYCFLKKGMYLLEENEPQGLVQGKIEEKSLEMRLRVHIPITKEDD